MVKWIQHTVDILGNPFLPLGWGTFTAGGTVMADVGETLEPHLRQQLKDDDWMKMEVLKVIHLMTNYRQLPVHLRSPQRSKAVPGDSSGWHR